LYWRGLVFLKFQDKFNFITIKIKAREKKGCPETGMCFLILYSIDLLPIMAFGYSTTFNYGFFLFLCALFDLQIRSEKSMGNHSVTIAVIHLFLRLFGFETGWNAKRQPFTPAVWTFISFSPQNFTGRVKWFSILGCCGFALSHRAGIMLEDKI